MLNIICICLVSLLACPYQYTCPRQARERNRGEASSVGVYRQTWMVPYPSVGACSHRLPYLGCPSTWAVRSHGLFTHCRDPFASSKKKNDGQACGHLIQVNHSFEQNFLQQKTRAHTECVRESTSENPSLTEDQIFSQFVRNWKPLALIVQETVNFVTC